MPKLFTAVDIPDPSADAPARLRSGPVPGLRNARRDQMPLTLHFIGEAEVDRVAGALQRHSASASGSSPRFAR